jgi:catechol 2,3-dioxygenase-like lactoylglutathione lyase family enzyme
VSDSFKTYRRHAAYGGRMSPRFDAIGLVASDMAASVAFYRRLGFAFPEGAENQPHAEAELPAGLRLMLDTEETVRSFHAGWQPPSGGSRTALALRCDSPAEVDAVYEELVAAGCHGELKPWDAAWGQRYASLHDPDGNGVDLYAPLPGAGQ